MYLSSVPLINLESRQPLAKTDAARGKGLMGMGHARRIRGLGTYSTLAQKYLPYWTQINSVAAANQAQLAAGLDAGNAAGYPGFISDANLFAPVGIGTPGGVNAGKGVPLPYFIAMWMPPATWPATWWGIFPAGKNAILNALGRGYAGDLIQVLSPISLIPSDLGTDANGSTTGQMKASVTALDTALTSGNPSAVQSAVNNLSTAVGAGQPQPYGGGGGQIVPGDTGATAPVAAMQPSSPVTSVVLATPAPGINSAPAVAAASIAAGMNTLTQNAGGGNPYANGGAIPESAPSGYQTTPGSVTASASGPTVMWIALAAVGAFLLFRRG